MNGTNIPFLFARLPLCCGKTRRPLPRKLVLSHPRKVYAQRRPQAHKRTSGHDRRWIQTPMTASPASPPRMNGRPAEPGVGSGHHPAVPPGYFPGIPRRPLSCVRQVQQIGYHGFHSRCFLACPLRRRRRRGQNRALRRHRERRRFLYLLFEQVHIQITTARQPLFVRFHRQRPD